MYGVNIKGVKVQNVNFKRGMLLTIDIKVSGALLNILWVVHIKLIPFMLI